MPPGPPSGLIPAIRAAPRPTWPSCWRPTRRGRRIERPYQARKAYDLLVQAEAGLMSIPVMGPVPDLGAHTDTILAELGFERATIDRWRDEGVV